LTRRFMTPQPEVIETGSKTTDRAFLLG